MSGWLRLRIMSRKKKWWNDVESSFFRQLCFHEVQRFVHVVAAAGASECFEQNDEWSPAKNCYTEGHRDHNFDSCLNCRALSCFHSLWIQIMEFWRVPIPVFSEASPLWGNGHKCFHSSLHLRNMIFLWYVLEDWHMLLSLIAALVG